MVHDPSVPAALASHVDRVHAPDLSDVFDAEGWQRSRRPHTDLRQKSDRGWLLRNFAGTSAARLHHAEAHRWARFREKQNWQPYK
jgi:hypothetical protein